MRQSILVPSLARARRAAFPLAVLAAVAAAGCASDPTTRNEGSWLGGAPPPPRLAMEEDGMPSQTPPLKRQHPQPPDDPREPFSPNYGPPPLPGEKAAPVEPVAPPAPVPPQRRQYASATAGG